MFGFKRTHSKNQDGFTLIELLVVVAIIGMLSSVVLSSLNTARANARDARRAADMSQIVSALELYVNQFGYYPPNTADGAGCPGPGKGNGSNCLEKLTNDLITNPLVSDSFLPSIPTDPLYGGLGGLGYLYYSNSTSAATAYSLLRRSEKDRYNENGQNVGPGWCHPPEVSPAGAWNPVGTANPSSPGSGYTYCP